MEKTEKKYIKRAQKDYSISFKLSVVQEHETAKVSFAFLQRKYRIHGSYTVKRWIEKYGNFDVSNQSLKFGKEQRSRAAWTAAEVGLLECKNARLEKELELKDMKAEFFDMMIDIAEKEYNIDIRKNSFPEQLFHIKKKNH